MKTIARFAAFSALAFLLISCAFTADGPSDSQVKELVTKSISGGMDAFCPDAEVLSVEILDRGEAVERTRNTYYPVDIEATLECGNSMLSSGGEKTQVKTYIFWLNNGSDSWHVSDDRL